MPVIGIPGLASPVSFAPFLASFRQGLAEAGYVEGQNVATEHRWAEGRQDRLPEVAADLVGRNVNVILTSGGPVPARATKNTTSMIPIVFIAGDPVGEVIRDVQEAARVKRLQLHVLKVVTEVEIDAAFATLVQLQPGGLAVSNDPFFNSRRDQIVALAARQSIPAIYAGRDPVAGGGLISYGSSTIGAYRRAAAYVGRILAGAKPTDLPVEQPTTFELVINLKTASALGLTVPPSILARASEVIE